MAPHLDRAVADAGRLAAQLRQRGKLLSKDRETDRLLDPHAVIIPRIPPAGGTWHANGRACRPRRRPPRFDLGRLARDNRYGAEPFASASSASGGQSAEHDISLRSARAVVAALAGEHEVALIYVQRDGTWRLADARQFIAAPVATRDATPALSAGPLTLAASAPARDLPSARSGAPPAAAGRGAARLVDLGTGAALVPLDVVFPVKLHGPFGEDGTMQGLLELAGVPYVGSFRRARLRRGHGQGISAKRLLRDAGIASASLQHRTPTPVGRGRGADLRRPRPAAVRQAGQLGSSVGVSKVTFCRDLRAAVATALRHDRKVLVEECIDGRELEVSVLGNDRRAASLAGEIVTSRGHEFYSYAAKYLDAEGAALLIPAPLTAGEQQRARELACRVCAVLEVEGMARVDFFLRPAAPPHRQSEFLVNEVNTIPGFTEISMYAKLWEASGVPFPELLRRLLDNWPWSGTAAVSTPTNRNSTCRTTAGSSSSDHRLPTGTPRAWPPAPSTCSSRSGAMRDGGIRCRRDMKPVA